jgi:putative ABC transport system permease protein
MTQGRFINQLDVDQARKVIVLSQKVVTSLFADPNSVVGQQVSYNGLTFTVIGVYEHRWRSTAFIPISTADMLQGKTGEVNEINVTLTDVNSTDKALKVEIDIRHTMSQAHEFDPDDQGAVSAWNRCENFLRMQLGGRILNISAWVIGLFTLLSALTKSAFVAPSAPSRAASSRRFCWRAWPSLHCLATLASFSAQWSWKSWRD